MAISWGSWEYGNSSAGFRVGLDVSQSTVTSASSSVTWTVKVYVEAMYNVDDAMTVTCSGNISGSDEQNLTTGSSGGSKLWFTKTYTYNYSTYGSSPGTRSFTASLSGVYNGATPSKTTTVTIPARPYAAPAAPSGVTATRNSDTQATVAWTRNATTAAPYTSVTVQRSSWTGTAWSAWATVATTSSTATSFVDTGVAANNQYRYQVKSNNSVGSSAYVVSGNVKMTPAAPTNAAAVLQSSGTSIVVTWTNNHYNDTFIDLTVQRSVAGGAYATVATLTDHTLTTWTDSAPGAGTNTYRVTALQTTGSLSSAAAASNTVSTTVPPLAPTTLSPNGIAVDWTLAQTLTWKHNPGGDGAAQTAFIIETSTNGGTSWSALNGSGTASSVSSYTVPANTLTNGVSRLWRVRTRGVASAGYGPNSASATVDGSATPVTAITGPATTITALPATATWTYSQANGSAQAAYELTLYKSGQVVESASGTTATSYVLTTPFQQGATYTLAVRTRSAAGIWSTSATRSLTISLLPPAPVTATATYQAETGTTVLSLTGNAPGAGEVAVVSATVERRVPGGSWVTLLRDVALPNDVLDLLPATKGSTEYRVTGKSATPTYREEAVVTVSPTGGDWVLVNYGDGFTQALRFRSNAEVSSTAGREKVAQRFLGRTRPVPRIGQGRTRVVTAAGSLVHDPTGADVVTLWDSPPEDWETAAQESEVVCFRDYTGRRVFGLLSDVSVGHVAPGLASVGFTVEETDWTEAYA
jgi:hypothetical protein